MVKTLRMNILGIDFSKNSPGVVRLNLDDKTLEVIDTDYLGFSTVKKVCDADTQIQHYHIKNSFHNDIQKAQFMRDTICDWITYDPDYCAFEGYAMKADGRVFDIAETTMCTKLMIYDWEIPIRIYDPNSIKIYATEKGNSDKIRIVDEFEKFSGIKPDLSNLPEYKSPKEDIVDAFWVAKLLQTELQLRRGLIQLKNLTLKQIEVFNRVTKGNPINILGTPFIKKVNDEE